MSTESQKLSRIEKLKLQQQKLSAQIQKEENANQNKGT